MFHMSIQYSLTALITDCRPLLSAPKVSKTKLKMLDRRIKDIYDVAFSRFCSFNTNITKAPKIPTQTDKTSIKKCHPGSKELSSEAQTTGRDVGVANTFGDFKKSIVYLDKAYGHYNLRIPKS